MARRLLVLTRHTPLPWEDGAGAYLFDVLRYLHNQGFEIHVGWLAPHEHLRWRGIWKVPPDFAHVVKLHTPGAWRFGSRQVYPAVYWLPFKARVLHATKRLFARVGMQVGRRTDPSTMAPRAISIVGPNTAPSLGWMSAPSPAEHAYAAALIARIQPSAVIANYAWMTPLFGAPKPMNDFLRVCIHPDVAWKRSNHQSALVGSPPAITSDTEGALLRLAELLVCISEADAVEHHRLAPEVPAIVAPKAFTSKPRLEAAPDSRRLLFVGSGNGFNVAGLLWFLRESWPRIYSSEPGACLDICGGIATAVPDRPAGVRFHGNVPDLQPYYRQACVVIVPLLHATGLNIKLVDAAALGCAIVTTPATLEGAPFLKQAVMSAETSSDFADAVITLLRDPVERHGLGVLAHAAVSTHLDPESCYAPLAARLR